jgi:ATP-binding cassette subfamily B protein
MITMGVMGLNRIFMSLSKASASADRIGAVIGKGNEWTVMPLGEAVKTDSESYIEFSNVSFSYGKESKGDKKFVGGKREKALDDMSFSLKKGQSLGIIGPTGCGKTTIINLLMRFYDSDEGRISIEGRDVRTFEKDELRKKFGVVFQNDMVFKDSLRNNIDFGRGHTDEELIAATKDAMAFEYIDGLDNKMEYQADIKGANLSGGQKQRLLVSRALAGRPDILILDDSSSALDYKTDSDMRKAIKDNHRESTLILIAQRVSSVMNMDKILVMDNGKCIGLGTHQELMQNCSAYRETYEMQTS